MKTLNGNILSSPNANVICQQVNCQGVMGAGLAKYIATKYPIVKKNYENITHPNGQRPSSTYKSSLLGDIQVVPLEEIAIINMFSQYNFGTDCHRVYTDYNAFKSALEKIADYCKRIIFEGLYKLYIQDAYEAVYCLKRLPITEKEFNEAIDDSKTSVTYTSYVLDTRYKAIIRSLVNDCGLDEARKAINDNSIQKPMMIVAFPYKIGCGLGNGDWNIIESMIAEFEEKYSNFIEVEIWKYER